MEEKVYLFVRMVPKGKVTTYKSVAEGIGNPKAYRSVGRILSKNPYPLEIVGEDHPSYVPCHRVVKSNGEVGGFFGSIKGVFVMRVLGLKMGRLLISQAISSNLYFSDDYLRIDYHLPYLLE